VRARAGRIVHCTIQELAYYNSPLCYARAAEGSAGEDERRRDEGTGDRAKAVARAAGGEAAGAGAWVIGG
jgi:hypothetical protein